MNLVVDIGNTRTKVALFEGNNLVEHQIITDTNQLLNNLDLIKKAKNAIIGSVVENANEFHLELNKVIPTLLFISTTKIPIINLYQTASTLGSDRIAASIGAFELYPNKHVLTIDTGTCIKYNFCNNKNEYLGGGISPGLKMRFRALNQFTSKLPFLEPNFDVQDLIGKNTNDSILSGVINGTISEIDGIINLYKEQFPEILVLLTGGDGEFFAKQLKNSIFAHQNLVLKGLNTILNFNLDIK